MNERRGNEEEYNMEMGESKKGGRRIKERENGCVSGTSSSSRSSSRRKEAEKSNRKYSGGPSLGKALLPWESLRHLIGGRVASPHLHSAGLGLAPCLLHQLQLELIHTPSSIHTHILES